MKVFTAINNTAQVTAFITLVAASKVIPGVKNPLGDAATRSK